MDAGKIVPQLMIDTENISAAASGEDQRVLPKNGMVITGTDTYALIVANHIILIRDGEDRSSTSWNQRVQKLYD
jgi:hypothetical protein